MAAGINDKFKKVSADNSYAVATTVRTARTVGGGTTLEAFDLSKWADATAVNFLTYRKTTDPVTNVTTVTNRTGWTALVNTGSNTLTNLTIAPGYTDLGHQVGDYIEPVQMSKWANDLVDGVLVAHNQDGTLKANSVTTAAIANNAVTADKLDFATLRKVLYAGPSATSGSVTLSESIMNFSSVEIVTKRSSVFCVTAPRGIVLNRVYSATISNTSGSVITFYSITYRFTSNTTLNIVGGGAVALNASGVGGFSLSNEIAIDSVVGIK